MKFLCLIGDGMADFPLDARGGRTPLQMASTPAMDTLASEGLCGLYWPIPEDMPPGSDIGNLSLFGYNPHESFSGRAPLEAANQGIALGPEDVAFRCNLVTLDDGVMKSFTADHISSEEAAKLIQTLDAECPYHCAFHPGVSYRHLAVIPGGEVKPDAFVATACTPPHDISEQAYREHLPRGPAAEHLCEIMEWSHPLLAEHPVNAARIAANRLPATSIWLWGQGQAPSMVTYRERFGLSGAVISAVDLVKGIGVCAGLEVIDVPGATGYIDTNYEGKVDAAFSALERVDFVYLHVEAPDECGHEGIIDKKVAAIEDFDRRVVGPCLEAGRAHDDWRILAAPDHVTALSTRTHAGGPVPFALWGAGVESNGISRYDEASAERGGLVIRPGHELVPWMIRADRLNAHNFQVP
ncbi:MAG: cofactor-independent phosphoglycerate mutase [Candidatus Hydrogenedentota bacterium]